MQEGEEPPPARGDTGDNQRTWRSSWQEEPPYKAARRGDAGGAGGGAGGGVCGQCGGQGDGRGGGAVDSGAGRTTQALPMLPAALPALLRVPLGLLRKMVRDPNPDA